MQIQKMNPVCKLFYDRKNEKVIEKQNSVLWLMSESDKDDKEFEKLVEKYSKK